MKYFKMTSTILPKLVGVSIEHASVYQELYYRYSISIRAHKKNPGETSYLDVAERIGCLDKIKNILNHLISKLELK